MTENKGKIAEKLSPAQIIEYKLKILSILDAGGAKTLSAAARMVGVSPTKVYDWNKSDENFRNQVRQGEKVRADSLIQELLELPMITSKSAMPWVTARIFLIKGFRPEFRDNYKIVEFKDQRGIQILEELRRLGKEVPKEEPKVSPEPENPLTGTIERVNYATK